MKYTIMLLTQPVFVLMLAKVIKFESGDGCISQGFCSPGAAPDLE